VAGGRGAEIGRRAPQKPYNRHLARESGDGEARQTLKEWRKLAEAELRGKKLAGLDWTTPEGITIKPLYTEADLDEIAAAGFPFREAVPGAPPYLRGPRATMYANRPWTIRSIFRVLDRRGIEPVLPR